MSPNTDREYGIRHLRPRNLSQLKKELRKQLTALRPAGSVNSVALRAFGMIGSRAASSVPSQSK